MVVVPVFERPTAVLEALDSVAAQSRPPDELVIVDDGSTDDTAERVARWLETTTGSFPTQLVRQPNRGVSAARNRGVEAAGSSDWVACLDSDDLWPREYLKAHLDVLRTRPSAVASSSDKESTDVPTGRRRRVSRSWVERDATRGIARRGPPGVSNTLLHAGHLAAVGGFPEHLRTAEDLDLMLRLSRRGPWLYVPETSATYRHRLGEARNEAPSLGHAHGDRRRTRAEVLDAFREAVSLEEPTLAREVGDLAARQWARAGRQFEAAGRSEDAIDCFDRALAERPVDLRSRWSRSRLRSRLGRGPS